MRYFISKNDVKTGPFTLTEMKGQPLTKHTLVWYEGLEEWTKANEILELLDLLIDNPPTTKPIAPLLYNTKQIF